MVFHNKINKTKENIEENLTKTDNHSDNKSKKSSKYNKFISFFGE